MYVNMERPQELDKEGLPIIRNKIPIGACKHTPIEDEDTTATRREVDMTCFRYDPNTDTYIYRFNGQRYTSEAIREYNDYYADKVYVMSEYAKMILG